MAHKSLKKKKIFFHILWLTQQEPTVCKSWSIADGPGCTVYSNFFACEIKSTQLTECLMHHKQEGNKMKETSYA